MKLANDNHIVMVDDNSADTFLAKECCRQSDVSNPWLSFTNGPDLLEYLEEVKAGRAPMPALVLLDINMPGMNGLETLQRIRVDAFFDNLPVFCVLTSSTDPHDRSDADRFGASGFVTKPDDIDEYVAFFNSLL